VTQASDRQDARARWAMRIALLLVLVPLVVSAIALVADAGDGYRPVSDHALNELRTRDVGHHAVLLGPFSRDGWFHPGPIFYYLFAVPYRLFGSTSVAMLLGALLVNGASIAGMAYVARRVGGAPAYYPTLVGCAVVTGSLGASFMRDPWNPFLPVLPFTLLVFLVWAACCRERWAVPAAAVVATFVVQTHVGFTPLAVPLFVFGVVVFVLRAPRRSWRELRVPLLVTVGLLFLLWLPPVVQQLTHEPGNFGQVARYFRDPAGETHAFIEGWRLVSAQFAPVPQWVTGPGAFVVFTGEPLVFFEPTPVPVFLAVFAGALALFRWRHRTAPLWLGATVGLALALGVVTVMRTIGTAFEYRLRWALTLGMLAGVVSVWAFWEEAEARRRQAREVLTVVALLALGAFAIGNSIGAVREDIPLANQSQALSELVRPTLDSLPDGDGEVVIRSSSVAALEYQSGLVLAMERAGVPVRVTGITSTGFGDNRIYEGGPVAARVAVIAVGPGEEPERRPPGRVVASADDGRLRIDVYVAREAGAPGA
jgi:hypothetical protein